MKIYRVKFFVPGFGVVALDVPACWILEAYKVALDLIKSSEYHDRFRTSARFNEQCGEVSCLSVKMKNDYC